MGTNLPTGTVTFLFTDIEGSTRLWQEQPQAMALSQGRHNTILRQAIESQHGYVVDIVGDAFAAAFHNALDGLQAAMEAQCSLQAESWGETGPMRVRMGLHTGAAEISNDGSNKYHEGYTTLASTQRVMSAAFGGQILLSQTTHDLLQDVLPAGVSLRDMGEHRLKDLRSPLRLYQLIAPGLLQDFPALKSLNNLPNNLPIQLTHFVGREQELSEVERLLAGTHLLTLTGPGGTGKTRLALQAAAAVLEQFPQGAWLVELAPVTDPQIVVQAIANVLTVRDAPGRSLLETLIDYFRYKSLLLVLDNCEHLIETCAELSNSLLHACPNLKILASSREPLGISGEVAFRVPSLSLPEASLNTSGDSLAELERSEAVCLFVERAQAVSPSFYLEQQNAPAVAMICRRLDGIPLAIELAAARVRVLSPTQIASRLDDLFRLLTGGSRTALPRQQTLKALIDWSWTLLSDSEKTLLRRLAVFTGGFNLEAVESICNDPVSPGEASLSEYEILDLLEGLANKSLIQVEEDASQARYRLLETIRQYALDQLLLSEEAHQLRDRHLAFFSHLAEQAEPHLQAAEMIEWMDRLERDVDNLRAALEWGLRTCSPAALIMAKGLAYYWMGCGQGTEGLRWLGTAVACLPDPPHSESGAGLDQATLQRQAIQAYLFSGAAMLAVALGQSLPAIQYSKEAEFWACASGNQHAVCLALTMKALAQATFETVNPQVRAAAEENLLLARQLGDLWLQCMILDTLARFASNLNDLAALSSYLQEHTRLAHQLNNPLHIVFTIYFSLYFSFMTGRANGDLLDIRREMEEGIRLSVRLKNNVFVTGMRSEFAHILRRRGELDLALAIYKETIHGWLELGNLSAVAHQFECLAALAMSRGQPERAAYLLGAAQALRTRLHSEMEPHERPDYEATLSGIRLQLDQAALQSAWSTGEAIGLEQAMAYALGENNM
jgi:predicted ATPase/class 3 adenylate cyclase